jgi:hypothetical protein
MHMDSTRFGGRAVVASAAFLIVSAIEVGRFITGQHWPELTLLGSNVGLLLVPVWLASAIGLVARKTWSWPLVLFAAIGLLGHAGIVGIAGNAPITAVYLVLGFAALGSIVRHLSTYGVQRFAEAPVVRERRERRFRPSYG